MDAGLLVLACAGTSAPGERIALRALLPADAFIEVFVGAPAGGATQQGANASSPNDPRPELRVVSSLGDQPLSHQPPEISMGGDGGGAPDQWEDDAPQISGAVALIARLIALSPGQNG